MDAVITAAAQTSPLSGGARTVGLVCHTSHASVIDVRYPAGTDFDTHVHEEAYLCLVRDGGYDEWLPGTTRRSVTVGADLIYPQGSRHAVRTGSQGAHVLHIADPSGRGWTGAVDPFRIGLLWQIAASVGRLDGSLADDADRLHLESLVIELRCDRDPVRDPSERTPGPLDGIPKWLDRVRARLREDYRAPVSLQELAKEVGRHPAHVTRAFRRRCGMTPGEYLRRIRVAAALGLIRQSSEPLSRVALSAGFTDQSHMNRWVRRYVGVTPGALREGSARPR